MALSLEAWTLVLEPILPWREVKSSAGFVTSQVAVIKHSYKAA